MDHLRCYDDEVVIDGCGKEGIACNIAAWTDTVAGYIVRVLYVYCVLFNFVIFYMSDNCNQENTYARNL